MFIRPDPVEAWSSNDRAVAVFGGGVSTYAHGYSVVVDSSGNIYTTGKFGSAGAGNVTVDFDPGAGTEELTSVGTHDVFVSKLDSSGNYVWAKNFGAVAGMFSFNRGEAVAVDLSLIHI